MRAEQGQNKLTDTMVFLVMAITVGAGKENFVGGKWVWLDFWSDCKQTRLIYYYVTTN